MLTSIVTLIHYSNYFQNSDTLSTEQKLQKKIYNAYPIITNVSARVEKPDQNISCSDLVYQSAEWEEKSKEKNTRVALISKLINRTDLSPTEKEVLSQEFGLRVSEYRSSTSAYPNEYSSLLPISITSENDMLEGEEFMRFLQLLESRDTRALTQWANERPMTSSTTFGGRSIISALIEHYDDISYEEIKGLSDAQITPTSYDLRMATEKNLDITIIKTLVAYTESNASITWFENNRVSSLAIIAIRNGNSELAEFWYSIGSPLTFGYNELNAADAFIENRTLNKQSKEKLLKILSSESIEPFDNANKTELIRLINDHFKHLYDVYLSTLNGSFKRNIQFEESAYKSAVESKNKIDSLNNEITNIADTLDYCKKRQLADIAATSDELSAIPTSSASEQRNKALALSLRQSANQGDWEAFIGIYREMANAAGHDDIISFAIIDLIRRQAPNKYVLQTVKEGYALSEITIFALIEADNIALAKDLLQYKLKIKNVYLDKEEPLDYAMKVEASQKMLKFLSEN